MDPRKYISYTTALSRTLTSCRVYSRRSVNDPFYTLDQQRGTLCHANLAVATLDSFKRRPTT